MASSTLPGGANITPSFVRDLRGTLEREKADVAVMVSLATPSKEMEREATQAEFLTESDAEGHIPRIQLITVKQLFENGRAIRAPGQNRTQMPKKSLPPAPGAQLDLALSTHVKKAGTSKPANSQSREKMRGPVKTSAVSTRATESPVSRKRLSR